MRRHLRLLPLVALPALAAAAWLSGLGHYLSWTNLAERQAALHDAVRQAPVAFGAAYVGTYILVTSLSFPGAVVLDIAGGLLLGTLLCTVLTVIGGTIGAVIVFLVARYALAETMRRRAGPFLDRLRPNLARDGFSYLLALRLIPVIPFWLLNLAPALVGMRLLPYAAATFLGIIPAAAVFAAIGSGVGGVLARGGRPDLSVIVSPPILLPLLGLALLSLLPVGWRHWRGARPVA